MIIRKSAAEIDRIACAGTSAETISRVGERIVPGITTLGSTGSPTSSSARTRCPPRRATRAIRALSASRPTTWSFTHPRRDGRRGRRPGDDRRGRHARHGDRRQRVHVRGGLDRRGVQRLLDVCQDALVAGVAEARLGNRIGDVSHAVQAVVEGAGFSVVKSLVGHGVGRHYHEDSHVPNFYTLAAARASRRG